jgi:putative salt-induced outer membrane protein
MKVLVLISSVLLAIANISLAADAPPADGWKNESQAGLVLTKGNSDTSTQSLGEVASYQFGQNIVKLTANYLYSKSSDVVSAKSWNLGLRYERILTDKFSIFAGESVEGNQFAGVNQRYNTDIGGKYTIVKDDELTWFAEAGYRYTKENLILIDGFDEVLARIPSELNDLSRLAAEHRTQPFGRDLEHLLREKRI